MAKGRDCQPTGRGFWSHGAVLAVLGENAAAARRTMREAVARVTPDRACPCRGALVFAILTDRSAIPEETKRRLAPLVGKYL